MTLNTNTKLLMQEYGGGHANASIRRVDNRDVDRVKAELVERIAADG